MSTNPFARGGASIVVKNPHDYVPNREGDAGAEVQSGQFVERADGAYVGGPGGLVVGLPIDPSKTKADTLDEGARLKLMPPLPGMILDLPFAAGEDAVEDDYVVIDDDGYLTVFDDDPGTDIPADRFGQVVEDTDATEGVEYGNVEVL